MRLQVITIPLAEYRRLLESEANLNLLHSRAVDHWDGYAVLPDIDDYETIVEWQVACAEFEANEL